MGFIKKSTVIINGSKKRQNLKNRLYLSLIIIIIDVVMIMYFYRVKVTSEEFAKQVTDFYWLNAQTVFSIDKIYMYSSANAIENPDRRAIWNLDIYQYTDIALYINNRSSEKLTYENAIKSLYIDNIKFTKVQKGKTAIYYKNINEFGRSVYDYALEKTSLPAVSTSNSIDEVNQENNVEDNQEENQEENQTENQEETSNESNVEEQPSQSVNDSERKAMIDQTIEAVESNKVHDKIEYTVLNDGDLDYSKPQIYTDCSNPITIEFVNSRIKENEIISDLNNDVVFDGNILRKTGVLLSDIACTISFNVHITNYYNQKYIATVYIDIPLEDTTTRDSIYNGKFVKKMENTNLVRFFRLE